MIDRLTTELVALRRRVALLEAKESGLTTVRLAPPVVLGADAALVTFSSIPQTYRDLILALTARKKNNVLVTGNVGLRPNADSGANYDYVVGYGNGGAGGTTATYEVIGDTMWQLGWLADDTAPAGQAGSAIIRICDYAHTTWQKNAIADFYASNQATTKVSWLRSGGTWRSTSAITSLDILDSNGNNFAAGSVFTLYGVP